MQVPHLAPTYAAVMALVSVHAHNEAGDGGDHGDYVDALAVIDRTAMYDFLMRMKQADGSFVMHEGGEVDVR